MILCIAKRLLPRRAVTTYGYVYVAQIAMGTDHAQTLKAIREAEAWHDPSIIIANVPFIRSALPLRSSKSHGLNMGKSQAKERINANARGFL